LTLRTWSDPGSAVHHAQLRVMHRIRDATELHGVSATAVEWATDIRGERDRAPLT